MYCCSAHDECRAIAVQQDWRLLLCCNDVVTPATTTHTLHTHKLCKRRPANAGQHHTTTRCRLNCLSGHPATRSTYTAEELTCNITHGSIVGNTTSNRLSDTRQGDPDFSQNLVQQYVVPQYAVSAVMIYESTFAATHLLYI